MVKLINIGIGNLLSIRNALETVGIASGEATSPDALANARAIILPGVGAFGEAMRNLDARGFVEPIQRIAKSGEVPILGICLGMQLLATESNEHGLHRGLGLIPGRVLRLSERETRNRVPNVGWCRTQFIRDTSLFHEAPGSRSFYYVHSFHLEAKIETDIAAKVLLGHRDIVSAVERGNVAGTQFHPEKSQADGLDLLATWAKAKGLLS